jgi:hypothetical protein
MPLPRSKGVGARVEVGMNVTISGSAREQPLQRRERGWVPAGVHDAKVVAHQRQRQSAEEGSPRTATLCRRRFRVQELAVREFVVAVEKPAVAVLGLVQQHVELVIAEHALRLAALHPAHHEVEHRRAIRAAVAQVADEHRATALGMPAVGGIAEVPEEGSERLGFAVDVADQIHRPVEQTGDRAVREVRILLQHATCIFTERWESSDRG